MDADDLELLRATVRAALTGDGDADALLDELGVTDLLGTEDAGVAIVLEELGRAARTSSLLDAVVLEALGLRTDDAIGVLYPLPSRGGRDRSTAWRSDGGVPVAGLLRSNATATHLLVVDRSAAAEWFAVVPAADLAVEETAGIDPDGGWRQVSGVVAAADAAAVEPTRPWYVAMSAARAALAAELLGLAREMRDIAIRHVTTREQFGQPVATFQTVRHRLAECHVDIAAAEAVLALVLSGDGGGSGVRDEDALVWAYAAKAAAGRAYETAARHAIQVCGAMGLTWEHPLHRYVRRGMALNALLGDVHELTERIGLCIVAGAELPTFEPLVLPAAPAGA